MSGQLSVSITLGGDVVLRVGPGRSDEGQEIESIAAHLHPDAADALAGVLTKAAQEGRLVRDLIAQVDEIDVDVDE